MESHRLGAATQFHGLGAGASQPVVLEPLVTLAGGDAEDILDLAWKDREGLNVTQGLGYPRRNVIERVLLRRRHAQCDLPSLRRNASPHRPGQMAPDFALDPL